MLRLPCTYDPAGRLSTETLNGAVKTYTYDASNQLTGDGVNTLTYDGTGNRTNGSNYVGPVNRLITDGTWNYTYDNDGNQTKKVHVSTGETWTYGYDQRNQLTVVEKRVSDGGTLQLKAEMKYDALGNRIEYKVDTDGNGSPNLTQRYALDGFKRPKSPSPLVGEGGGEGFSPVGLENWDVWADLNAPGSLTTRYLRGDVIDQVFAQSLGGTVPFWLVADRLGSIRDVVYGNGLNGHLDYDGFGNVLTDTTTVASATRYAWTGRQRDKETGLQFHRARYYDPATGRWLSPDPMGFSAGDSNLYRYANNQVTTATDPSGQYLLVNSGRVAQHWVTMLGNKYGAAAYALPIGDNGRWYIGGVTESVVRKIENDSTTASDWSKNLARAITNAKQHVIGYDTNGGYGILWDTDAKAGITNAERTSIQKELDAIDNAMFASALQGQQARLDLNNPLRWRPVFTACTRCHAVNGMGVTGRPLVGMDDLGNVHPAYQPIYRRWQGESRINLYRMVPILGGLLQIGEGIAGQTVLGSELNAVARTLSIVSGGVNLISAGMSMRGTPGGQQLQSNGRFTVSRVGTNGDVYRVTDTLTGNHILATRTSHGSLVMTGFDVRGNVVGVRTYSATRSPTTGSALVPTATNVLTPQIAGPSMVSGATTSNNAVANWITSGVQNPNFGFPITSGIGTSAAGRVQLDGPFQAEARRITMSAATIAGINTRGLRVGYAPEFPFSFYDQLNDGQFTLVLNAQVLAFREEATKQLVALHELMHRCDIEAHGIAYCRELHHNNYTCYELDTRHYQ